MHMNKAWTILGPGGGGSHYIPTVNPHDPDNVLTCSDMTGAYITYDGARTWREFNLRIRVDAYAFDPVNPKVIYAGSSGLFRSQDGGEKWQLIFPNPESVIEERMVGDEADNLYITRDNWPGGKVQSIHVDPDQNQHIYVGVNLRATLIDVKQSGTASDIHVFYSDNNGNTWTELTGAIGGRVHQFFVDPSSPFDNRRLLVFTDAGIFAGNVREGILKPIDLPPMIKRINYASWGINPQSGKSVLYITSPTTWIQNRFYSGVWKSTDHGETWQALNGGLDSNLAKPEKGKVPSFYLLSACEKDAGVVYMTVRNFYETVDGQTQPVPYTGIMKSEDEGNSWKWVLKQTYMMDPPNKKLGWVERNYTPEYSGTGPKGNSYIGIGVSASNSDICYITDMGAIYRTLDGGENWEQVYSNDYEDGTYSNRGGMDVTTCYGMHFDPFDKDHIVISYTDIGMMHSKNGGKSWKHAIDGVPPRWSNTCYWMVFDPDIKGKAWSVWGYSHDLPRGKMFDGDGHFDRSDGGVCRTEDGAETWEVSNAGMPRHSVSTHIILDPKSEPGNRTLYAAVFDRGVYKSTDDGRTWVLKNNGFGKNLYAWRFAQLPDGTIYLIMARGRRDGQPVYGEIYVTRDGAENWEKLPMPNEFGGPHDIVFDPTNPKRMYMSCWPTPVDGVERYGGLYKTEDGGQTWERIFDESAHVNGIHVDAECPSNLYIATFDSSAYRSEDFGQSWKRLGGYNFKWGQKPFLDPHHKGMLYITTYGSSVWYGPAEGVEGAFEDICPIE